MSTFPANSILIIYLSSSKRVDFTIEYTTEGQALQ